MRGVALTIGGGTFRMCHERRIKLNMPVTGMFEAIPAWKDDA